MPIDDEDDDDAPRRKRRRRDNDDDDYEHDRPVRPVKKSGGAGRVVLIILGVCVVGGLLCCGGPVLLYFYLRPMEVEVLDAARDRNPSGGTGAVKVTLRVGSNKPGNMVFGDYVFIAKAGDRMHIHRVSLRGDGGAEYKTSFFTPELEREPGPVEFWVEKDDRGSTSRVSKVRTIP